ASGLATRRARTRWADERRQPITANIVPNERNYQQSDFGSAVADRSQAPSPSKVGQCLGSSLERWRRDREVFLDFEETERERYAIVLGTVSNHDASQSNDRQIHSGGFGSRKDIEGNIGIRQNPVTTSEFVICRPMVVRDGGLAEV